MILLGMPKGPGEEHHADGGQAGDESQDPKDSAVESCAEDLISAVHSRDAKGVAEQLRYIFELLESEPHEEAEPEDEGE